MKKIYLLTIVLLTSNFMHSQCNVNNPSSNSLSTNNADKVYDYAQSFKATCSGNMENFSLVTTNTGTAPAGTLKIFSGNTVSGTPIYTQSYGAITNTTAGDPLVYSITGTVPLILNNIYTFNFELQTIDVEYQINGPYVVGNLWQDGSTLIADFIFSVSIIGPSLSIESYNQLNSIKIYPNPSYDFIKISGIAKTENYKVYNQLGAVIFKGEIIEDEEISIKNLSNGLYFLKFDNGNTIKFIKR